MVFVGGVYAQQKPVIISKEQVGNQIYLTAENTSDQDYYVNLLVTSTGFTLDRNNPVNDMIVAGEKKLMMILTAQPGTQASYKYRLKPTPVEQEEIITQSSEPKEGQKVWRTVVANSAKQHESRARKNVVKKINPDKVTIFVRDDCNRCEYLLEYLEAFNVDHEVKNVSNNIGNNELMWDALYVFGKKEGRITLPVITHNKEIHYSIEDLEGFVHAMVGEK